MVKSIHIFWISIAISVFVGANLFFSAQGNYLLNFLPIALSGILLGLLSLEHLLLVLVFLSPLSIRLQEYVKAPFDLSLPTEPYLAFIVVIYLLKLLTTGGFDKRIFKHPISIAIYFYMGWKLVTCLTSTMVLVSIKQFIAQIWFIVPFYFFSFQMFTEKKRIRQYMMAYAIGLIFVCIYTLIHHSMYGFTYKSGNWVMSPFYKDHTSYGAVLALIIPVVYGIKKSVRKNASVNFFYWFAIFFFIIALVFSYTRAAWLSLAGALGIWIVTMLKIKFSRLVTIGVVAMIFIAPFTTDILIQMKQNDVDSSTDFKDHVKSMSNISTDASNLERINRWNCAIRMFKEKPVFGWGPGTYMFNYAPFQFSYERTIISTNAATLGNAHSEYLGRLSESGLLGLLFFLIIIGLTIHYAFKIYNTHIIVENKTIALYLILGIITYYAHSFLNNFLDTDKLASIFWGITAAIAALDTFHKEGESRI